MPGLLLVFALAACAAAPGDLKAPQTAEHWRQVNAERPRVDRIIRRLVDYNADLCHISRPCRVPVNIKIGPVGAFASPDAIYLSAGLLHIYQRDDELALTIAHEWAHHLLGHKFDSTPWEMQLQEIEADCVGAILAYRAFYDLGLAAQGITRLANSQTGIVLGLFGSGPHRSFVERKRQIVRVAESIGARSPGGIMRGDVRTLCGVAP